MYVVRIKTKYNTIELFVDDLKEIEEILYQPYIEQVYIDTIEHYYQEEKERLLNHVVGMSYNTNRVLELKKKLEEDK